MQHTQLSIGNASGRLSKQTAMDTIELTRITTPLRLHVAPRAQQLTSKCDPAVFPCC